VDSDNPVNSGKAGDALVSPKFGLVLGPWSNIEYFANTGHGFHSNDARGATISVDPVTGAPASRVTPLVRAIGSELGVRAAPLKGFQTSLALWRLDLASELVFAGDAGTTEASRPSRRQGVEWANYYRPFGTVTFDFDLTLSRARFRDDAPAGNYIPGSTDRTLSGGVTFGGKEGWSGGLRLRYFGPRALIEDNSQRSGSSTLVNAGLGYAINRQAKIGVEVLNLFNRKVDDITYFYASRLQGDPAAGVEDKHFHPAEPRSLRVLAVLQF
jgi:outer membrane receptor protein involved in Fe transport